MTGNTGEAGHTRETRITETLTNNTKDTDHDIDDVKYFLFLFTGVNCCKWISINLDQVLLQTVLFLTCDDSLCFYLLIENARLTFHLETTPHFSVNVHF